MGSTECASGGCGCPNGTQVVTLLEGDAVRSCDPDDLAILVASALVAVGRRGVSIRLRRNASGEAVAIEVWCGDGGGVRVAAFDCQPIRLGAGFEDVLNQSVTRST